MTSSANCFLHLKRVSPFLDGENKRSGVIITVAIKANPNRGSPVRRIGAMQTFYAGSWWATTGCGKRCRRPRWACCPSPGSGSYPWFPPRSPRAARSGSGPSWCRLRRATGGGGHTFFQFFFRLLPSKIIFALSCDDFFSWWYSILTSKWMMWNALVKTFNLRSDSTGFAKIKMFDLVYEGQIPTEA